MTVELSKKKKMEVYWLAVCRCTKGLHMLKTLKRSIVCVHCHYIIYIKINDNWPYCKYCKSFAFMILPVFTKFKTTYLCLMFWRYQNYHKITKRTRIPMFYYRSFKSLSYLRFFFPQDLVLFSVILLIG
jgi:hypothetical protein